ncbi:MAG: GIY-YIG nuclease family protein [bacterium]
MKQGWMYILECADGSYYTGSTNNLELRLQQHQAGEGANHTKKRLPVKLVYFEEFYRIDEAFYREKQVQGWSRKKKEALINGRFNELNKLSECQNETHYKNAAFDFAQAAGENRWLSGAETTDFAQAAGENRWLSGAETTSNKSEKEPK